MHVLNRSVNGYSSSRSGKRPGKQITNEHVKFFVCVWLVFFGGWGWGGGMRDGGKKKKN